MDKRALGYKYAAECARAHCRRVRASRATRARISSQQGAWAADLEMCTRMAATPRAGLRPCQVMGFAFSFAFTFLTMMNAKIREDS